MSREVKVGILAIVTIFMSVWGYKFVKGSNMFKSTKTFTTTFDDVTGLNESSSVFLNGLKVGQVLSIKLNPGDVKTMDVVYNIDDDIPLPKNAIAQMRNEGIMGGKFLALSFDKPCSGSDCAQSGQRLEGEIVGFLGSMIPEEEMGDYFGGATGELRALLSEIGAQESNAKIDVIVRNLEETVIQVNQLTNAATKMIEASSTNLSYTISNFNKISKNLADNNEEISEMISNLNAVSKSLKDAQLDQTIEKTNGMIDNTSAVVNNLEGVISKLDETLAQLSAITTKMNEGEGSLGKLVNDKELYNHMNETSKNLSLLLQDLRLNPKRYVNVSIFGKKSKEYTLPEDDPAEQK
jgi:phospholipid/cholesterol/gamma-HCH transport system substrate-binding protein